MIIIKTKETEKAKEPFYALQFLSLCQAEGHFTLHLPQSLHILLNHHGHKLLFWELTLLKWNKYNAGADAPDSIKHLIFSDNLSSLGTKYCSAVSNDALRAVFYMSISLVILFFQDHSKNISDKFNLAWLCLPSTVASFLGYVYEIACFNEQMGM